METMFLSISGIYSFPTIAQEVVASIEDLRDKGESYIYLKQNRSLGSTGFSVIYSGNELKFFRRYSRCSDEIS